MTTKKGTLASGGADVRERYLRYIVGFREVEKHQ